MRARNSGVILRDGILRVDRVYLKLCVFSNYLEASPLTDNIQALQFGEIKEMADRAGLFKYGSFYL